MCPWHSTVRYYCCLPPGLQTPQRDSQAYRSYVRAKVLAPLGGRLTGLRAGLGWP